MDQVILLFGGKSEERLVSVASAQNLAEQYDFSELIFQDKNERLFRVAKPDLLNHKNVFLEEFIPNSTAVAENLETGLELFKEKIVFLGWHGSFGENGQIQKLFEQARIFFTGSGSAASKAAFEKDLAKSIIADAGLKMPEQLKFKTSQLEKVSAHLIQFLARYKKIVIKPIGSGSSYGLHIVSSAEQLTTAIKKILDDQFENYLVENFVSGRELTVGVIQQENELISLPPSEIIVNEGSAFDYEGKYLGTGSQEITPAELTSEEFEAAQKMALDAHIALGCYGYSRTDMILTNEGPYFLETNTLPGLSKPSFIPQQLLAADIAFKSFITAQIKLASLRYLE